MILLDFSTTIRVSYPNAHLMVGLINISKYLVMIPEPALIGVTKRRKTTDNRHVQVPF